MTSPSSSPSTLTWKHAGQVQHAKRTQSLAHLPPYQAEMVRAVAREVRDLDRDVTTLLAPFGGGSEFDPSAHPAAAYTLLVHHLCMRRNKRCLLAYHRVRVQRIEELCWSGGGLGDEPDGAGGEGEDAAMAAEGGGVEADAGPRNALSPEEEEYMRGFADLLAAAKGRWTDIDLTGSLEPPRDLFVDVRVLKDAGEIQTEYGCVSVLQSRVGRERRG